MLQSPSKFDVSSVNDAQQCDVDITIPRRSFVFGQSRVYAGEFLIRIYFVSAVYFSF